MKDVLDFYDDVDGESQNPNVPTSQIDEELNEFNFADDKTDTIIAFIKAFNDESFPYYGLEIVPSRLPSGGNIECFFLNVGAKFFYMNKNTLHFCIQNSFQIPTSSS